MCTMTAIMTVDDDQSAGASSSGAMSGERSLLRVVFSRDEQRSRPDAQAPEVVDLGDGRHAIMPIDPVSGGTWIAVNDSGLLLALLNANPTGGVQGAKPTRSRGKVIPALLDAKDVDAAAALMRTMDLSGVSRFRLVAIARGVLREMIWDGQTLTIGDRQRIDRPVMFTSSGLGDAVVEGPRRELFETMTAGIQWDAQRQDGYHRHRWPRQPELSVWMDRADAVTVSWTTIEVSLCRIRMCYSPATHETSAMTMRTLTLRA